MPAKSSSRGQNKKLTEFFIQRPTSVSALATSSGSEGATTMSATRRAAMQVSTDRESTHPSAPLQVHSASTMITRKRARSPDNNDASISPSKLRSPGKSRKTLQSNSDSGRPKAIVYITSPVLRNSQTSTPAWVHNHNSVVSPSDSSKQVVYSSQSDEAELVLPNPRPRDLKKVIEGVDRWRRSASQSSPSSAVEVDMLLSSPVLSEDDTRNAPLHFGVPIRAAMTTRSSASHVSVVAFPNLSPPPDTNELPPLPPTPQPIDPEIKAAKLIAEIKARAFAAHQSSDDEQPLSFRELEDSDDDELMDDLPLTGGVKEKRKSSLFSAPRTPSTPFSSPLSSAPSAFDDRTAGLRARTTPGRYSPTQRPTRTSTRARQLVPAFHLPLTIAKSSASVGVTKPVSVQINRKKSAATNPLRALLREKELEDKRGTSGVALRLAEEAIKQGSHETFVGSDDDLGTLTRLRLADEQAAWKAVHESRESGSPVDPDGAEDITIGNRESEILGAATGEAINRILAGDKDNKRKDRNQNRDQKMTMGVSLWVQCLDEDMEVDSMPFLPLSGHSVLTCLNDIRKNDDDSLLDLVLRAGTLTAVPGDVLLSNMPQFISMALFASSQVSDAVFIALRGMWGPGPQNVQMPLAAILSAFVQLGANRSVLKGFGLIAEHVPKNHTTYETHLEALKRLLVIIRAAGFAGAFPHSDVANVVLSLVIMGLDSSTSNELRMQLNIALDTVCNHSATDYLLHDIHEKVLGLARQLAPVNKALLVSFFASGSGRTRGIARHLAYCLLVSGSTTPSDHPLPLEPLILLLSPDAGSCELFDVTNERTDYDELRHYVNILSVALTDIAPYVDECNIKSTSSTCVQGSPSNPKRSLVPPLELLRRVLDSLQGKIVDTRAAHLDRSRTKAAIQRLTMRIYYDRMALTGVRPRRRASTLKAYFSPQRR